MNLVSDVSELAPSYTTGARFDQRNMYGENALEIAEMRGNVGVQAAIRTVSFREEHKGDTMSMHGSVEFKSE